VYTCNPNTLEAKAGESQVQDEHRLPFLRKTTKMKENESLNYYRISSKFTQLTSASQRTIDAKLQSIIYGSL
jgi:hypothetical protein